MKSAIARREKILEILSERRCEKMTNLAQEFKVTRRRILSDIAILSEKFPIYTETGTYGGVYVVDEFRHRMKYLTDKQYEILYQISERLDGEEKTVVLGILKTFAYPKKGVDGKKSST